MPWRKVSLMDQRKEFVRLFQQPDVNRRELCRRFGISPKVGYKWLARATVEEKDWARDRSRRPHVSPTRSPTEIETAVLEIRDAHPAWGARKIHHCLEGQHESVPSSDPACPHPATGAAAAIHSLRASSP
jgi:transposase-like protein